MPKDALPEKLDDAEEWKGTDWDNKFQRWLLPLKGLFAFGPRARQRLTFAVVPFPFIFYFPIKMFLTWKFGWMESGWWYLWPVLPIPVLAKWRTFPIVLFALFGKGEVRWESTDGQKQGRSESRLFIFEDGFTNKDDGTPMYMSVIQYWSKWSICLYWPLHFVCHYYFKEPPVYPDHPVDDHKMIFHRQGARRDADIVTWFWTWFTGATFN